MYFQAGRKKQRESLYSVKSNLRHRTKVKKNLAHSGFKTIEKWKQETSK